jgi:26S proteasome regulatory subunit T3
LFSASYLVITNTFSNSTGIVQSSTGSNYVVRILSTLDREKLKPSSSVALHRHSNALVDILPPEADSSIAMLGAHEKPDVTYADVGGLDMQKQEIREAVELPLTHFDLYKQIGQLRRVTRSKV